MAEVYPLCPATDLIRGRHVLQRRQARPSENRFLSARVRHRDCSTGRSEGRAIVTKKLVLALLFIVALPLAAQINDTYIIPASANSQGLFGTRWLTQLSIFNPQLDHPLKVSVTYLPTDGGKGLEALVTVPANSVAFADNSLLEVFGLTNGSGALVVATFPVDNPGVPDDVVSRAFLVTTNTFNNSSNGTYGSTVPGIWSGLQDYSADGINAVAHGVRNIAKCGWRTNFGAVNLGSSAVTLRINVYDAKGNTILENQQ